MLGTILVWILQVYLFALFGRLVLELVRSVNPSWRPRGLVLVLAEVTFTITAPPLRLFRKVIKPIRVGGFALDLAWTALVFAVMFAQSLASRL